MNTEQIINLVKKTESPLKRQLLMAALISKLLKERGKALPVVIGGCALSYYSREVYFTADIDFAYSDREAMNDVLLDIGFQKQGRYWVNDELKLAVEVPASSLVNEDSPTEAVELDEALECVIIGIEDLIIDRLNACKYWQSTIDCEMAELLIRRYCKEIDWEYLEKRASMPENDLLAELLKLKETV